MLRRLWVRFYAWVFRPDTNPRHVNVAYIRTRLDL
jgi:hypothetical protein